jgi:hypothetical protein
LKSTCSIEAHPIFNQSFAHDCGKEEMEKYFTYYEKKVVSCGRISSEFSTDKIIKVIEE